MNNSHKTFRLSLLLPALLSAACGQSANTLSGSIGSSLSLSFDTVQVRRVLSSYKIIYTSGGDAALNTVADLVYTPGATAVLAAGQPYNLDFSAAGDAALTRATSDGLSFPDPQSGTLTFDQTLSLTVAAGTQTSGHFGVLFTTGGTLSGTFSAPLTTALE